MITVEYKKDGHGQRCWEVSGADLRTQGLLLDAIPRCRLSGLDRVINIRRRAMGATEDESVASITARVLALAQSLART